MCFELEDAKCSTLSIREYSMAVDLSSSLYSVHVDGSSSLYGPCCQISNMSIDSIGIHMHLPGEPPVSSRDLHK